MYPAARLLKSYLTILLIMDLVSAKEGMDKKQKVRKELNKKLEVNVKGDEAEENFAWVQNQLSAITDQTQKTDMELFLKLKGLEQRCDEESYQILNDNNQVNELDVDRYLSTMSPLNRVSRILYPIIAKHSEFCYQKDLELLTEALAYLDQTTIDNIEVIWESIIKARYKQIWNWKLGLAYRDTIMIHIIPSLMRVSEEAKGYLLYHDSRKLKNSVIDSLVDLYRKYFIQSCEIYTSHLRPAMKIAMFDINALDKDIKVSREYGLTVQRYKLCLKILGPNAKSFEERFREVLKTSTKDYKEPN